MKNKQKKSRTKKQKIVREIVVCVIALFLLFACDLRMKTVVYKVESEKINEEVTIALVTDLHACRYGKNQHTLLEAIDRENPDIVLLGGDIFDDKLSYKHAKTTVKYLSEKYPCYYVTGNHEYWSKDIDSILSIIESYGINILSGAGEEMTVRGQKLWIAGIDDPDVEIYTRDGVGTSKQLEACVRGMDQDVYSILLSHRPELIDTYKQYSFDLILTGHAHGGQWRIPFVLNGVYAPNQGVFPEYAGGRYDFEQTTMIVSRGLARESLLVPRVFNRPELVIVKIM